MISLFPLLESSKKEICGRGEEIKQRQRKGRRCEERRSRWPKQGPGTEEHDPETEPTEKETVKHRDKTN